MDPKKNDPVSGGEKHKIRMTLTSRHRHDLQDIVEKLIRSAKDKNLSVKGPVRLPTKTLRITTRKSPCGEGTNTWDRFQMRIHKQYITLEAPAEVVKQITSISIQPTVEIEVTIVEQITSISIQPTV